MQGGRVAIARLHIGRGDGQRRGRAILAEARVRVAAVRDGGVGMPAIGRRPNALAHTDLRSPREQAGDHVEAFGCGLLFHDLRKQVRDALGVVIGD